LEIYEADLPSKTQLEELCDVRQPILFDFARETDIAMVTHPRFLATMNGDVELRELGEEKCNDILLPIGAWLSLFQKSSTNSSDTPQYITENNAAFLQKSGITKLLKNSDTFLRPAMMSHCNYDVMMGTPNAYTPFRYLLSYRNFFIVTEGSVRMKISPPSSSFPLHKDYVRFEFASPVHPWNLTNKDIPKCLELTLHPGKTFFLPAYWWYSIQYSKGSSVTSLHYHTYMSTLSVLPHFGIYVLQMQNIKHPIAVKNVAVKKEKIEDSATTTTATTTVTDI